MALFALVIVWTTSQAHGATSLDTGEFDPAPNGALEEEDSAPSRTVGSDTPIPSLSALEQCAILQKRGATHVAEGRYNDAIADLTQAYLQASDLRESDACLRWRIRSLLATAYHAAGDLRAEIDILKQALAETGTNKPGQRFFLHIKLAFAFLQFGAVNDAKRELAGAQEEAGTMKSKKSWVQRQSVVTSALHSLEAHIASADGRYREAESLLRMSLDEGRAHLALQSERYASNNAQVHAAAENLAQRERQLATALMANGKSGEAALLAQVALNDAVTLSHDRPTLLVANSQALIGQIYLRQGRLDVASRFFNRSLDTLQTAQVARFSRSRARIRALMGLTLSLQEDWAAAIKQFDERDRELRENPQQFSDAGSRNLDWALCLIRTSRAKAAQRMLETLEAGRKRRGYNSEESLAFLHGYLGIALAEQGKTGLALKQFALAMPELSRSILDEDLADDEGGFVRQFRVRQIFEAYLSTLSEAYSSGRSIKHSDPANEAFAIADLSRSSSVQRAVLSSAARVRLPEPGLAQLAREVQDAANRSQALNRLLESLSERELTGEQEAAITAVKHETSDVAARRTALRKELARKYPAYGNLVDPPAITAADAQRVLRPGEGLVSIYIGERQSYVWSITPKDIRFRAVAMSREEATRRADALQRSVDLTSGRLKPFDSIDAERLYAALLAPDADLWESTRLLNVLPGAPLGRLPFGLLLTKPVAAAASPSFPDYRLFPWLLAKMAIAQQASASALVALRTAPAPSAQRLPFVGFGNPVFDGALPDDAQTQPNQVPSLAISAAEGSEETTRKVNVRRVPPRLGGAAADDFVIRSSPQPNMSAPNDIYSRLPPLPDTAEEITIIARLLGAQPERDVFLGPRATVTNVRRTELVQYRIVAFATHSIGPADVAGLDEPALALSNPVLVKESGSGLLGLDDILALKLNADWVILSACNTASGDGVSAEAASGLGRGFLYAGARSLLVSNWAVETVSARLLTTEIFRQFQAHPSMPRALALQAASLELIEAADGRYGHPSFWAAFSLFGDGADQ
ncbi:CHAT domain-containing tetratricopeptide repeat protein [Paraburkholderia dipogonis]|uniref:CHAT domain-containing tetratricopeptide repeat protein n=1 Tax=Paraburkholderia dipogonis TaxID=1211383 RepID=UPI00141BE361|nr:CHAT domain-containing tetratricopeptide repeat protein [Paraburkholderia dipogonis]